MFKTILFLLTVSFLFTGCTGGKTSGTQTPAPIQSAQTKKDYYVNKTVGYRVEVPKGWLTEPLRDADLLMKNTEGSFTPEPSINIVSQKVAPFSLTDKKNQQMLKDEINPGLKTAEESTLKIGEEDAYRFVYGLEQSAISLIITQTSFFHRGYLIVITCGCREDEYLRFKKPMERIIDNIELF